MTVGAIILAALTLQIDQRVDVPYDRSWSWLLTGTPQGARGVLGAIASGIITVTGVIFSVTIVALQLASTQFTPRILRNFTADRGNQVVLGVFIGTFTYTILVLRMVRGDTDDFDAIVPYISVTVAVFLAIVSIGFLIFFIDHAARSVQASVIIDRVTRDTLATLERTLPEQVGEPADEDVLSATPSAQGTTVTADQSGYLQGVDEGILVELLRSDGYTIRIERRIGEFIFPESTLATIWPAGLDTDSRIANRIRESFIVGPERTPGLDPELGIIELADIAVKALSPSINDPTTAVLCLDRLTEVLVAYGRRTPPGRIRRASDGRALLILPRPTFDDAVETALDQIRHFGVENPHFAVNLLERIGAMADVLPRHRHPPLARQVAATLREARVKIVEPSDLGRVEKAAIATLERLGPTTPAA